MAIRDGAVQCKTALKASDLIHLAMEKEAIRRALLLALLRIRRMALIVLYEGDCWFQTRIVSLASNAPPPTSMPVGRTLGSNWRLAVLASGAGHGGYGLYLVSQPLVFKPPRK